VVRKRYKGLGQIKDTGYLRLISFSIDEKIHVLKDFQDFLEFPFLYCKHICSTTRIKTILILRDDRAAGNGGDGETRG
jgi:hypothetical protein